MAALYKSHFYINSGNRISGTDGQFKIEIPYTFIQDYDKVAVMAASIPKTFYQVQNGFNTFTLKEGAANIAITVPAGTYTRASFMTAMSALLTASSSSGFVYTMSIPNIAAAPETGKYTYTVTGSGSTAVGFSFSSQQNIYEQMGFPAQSTTFFTSGTLVSTNVCNMSAENCLFLHSDICYNADTGDNILQEIYTGGVVYNSFVTFTNYNVEWSAKNILNKSSIYEFSLTDEFGVPINLNGINMTITLVMFRTNKIDKTIENYIRYRVNDS
jgi:hypothetical protein